MSRRRLREGKRPPRSVSGGNDRTWNWVGKKCPVHLKRYYILPGLWIFWCTDLILGTTFERGPTNRCVFWEVMRTLKVPESMWYVVNELSAREERISREAGKLCSGHWGISNNVLCYSPDAGATKFCGPASKRFLNSGLPRPKIPGSPGSVKSYSANAGTVFTLMAGPLGRIELKTLRTAFKVCIDLTPACFSRIIHSTAHQLSVSDMLWNGWF